MKENGSLPVRLCPFGCKERCVRGERWEGVRLEGGGCRWEGSEGRMEGEEGVEATLGSSVSGLSSSGTRSNDSLEWWTPLNLAACLCVCVCVCVCVCACVCVCVCVCVCECVCACACLQTTLFN